MYNTQNFALHASYCDSKEIQSSERNTSSNKGDRVELDSILPKTTNCYC